MTYFCEKCGFVFSRMGEVEECPFCGGFSFHPSTPEKAEELRKELMREVQQKMGVADPSGTQSEE